MEAALRNFLTVVSVALRKGAAITNFLPTVPVAVCKGVATASFLTTGSVATANFESLAVIDAALCKGGANTHFPVVVAVALCAGADTTNFWPPYPWLCVRTRLSPLFWQPFLLLGVHAMKRFVGSRFCGLLCERCPLYSSM